MDVILSDKIDNLSSLVKYYGGHKEHTARLLGWRSRNYIDRSSNV